VTAHHLTKSHFQVGLDCPRKLWWVVHEPEAPELTPDASLLWNLRQGNEVTRLAHTHVPDARYERTLRTGTLEARIDMLAPLGGGRHALIEVKGSNSIKREHLWDVAFQLHVAGAVGLDVGRVELMHLNPDCRHPELDSIFLRVDVGTEVAPLHAKVQDESARMLDILDGSLPGDSRNATCSGCPFHARCWSDDRFSVHRLHRMKWSDKLELERSGTVRMTEVPEERRLTPVQRRQRESARGSRLIVEPSLGGALKDWVEPLVYLDFETVSFAIPRFPGTKPWNKIPVQFSVHRSDGGELTHHAFLAPDDGDPRRALAESLIEHCTGGGSVVTYHSSFEKGRLEELALALPDLEAPLMKIHERVVDLEPIVTQHVYHPDFNGSFSLKVVLPALCPELTYDDLAIRDGAPLPDQERQDLRQALLAYCERDTLAMVALHERLLQLS